MGVVVGAGVVLSVWDEHFVLNTLSGLRGRITANAQANPVEVASLNAKRVEHGRRASARRAFHDAARLGYKIDSLPSRLP